MENGFVARRVAWVAGALLVASMGIGAHRTFAEEEPASSLPDAVAVQAPADEEGLFADAVQTDVAQPEEDGLLDVFEELDESECQEAAAVPVVAAAEAPWSPTNGTNAAPVSAYDFLTEEQIREALVSPADLDARGTATFANLLLYAEQYLGMPYVWGGKNPYRDGSFDCSGFVSWVMNNVCGAGIDGDQENAEMIYAGRCTPISRSDARPGDLVFFTGTYGGPNHISHVGIYCGNGIMIDAGDPIGYHYIDAVRKEDGSPAGILFGRLNGVTVVNESTTDISLLGHLMVEEQLYTGEPVEPDVYLTVAGAPLFKDVDYVLSYADNVEMGTATVVVEGIGAYRGTLTAQFAIVPGVEIAVPPTVVLGAAVTVEPRFWGLDPREFVYNYGWNFEGQWDEWDSVVRSTGLQTPQTSWEFTPSKTGRYELFVDVVSPQTGAAYTTTAWIEVVSPMEVIYLAGHDVELGEAVRLSAVGPDVDLNAYAYNFVWCYEGRWDAWDSVVLSTGSMTQKTEWEFVPTRLGRYQLFMDVADGMGNVRTTSMWVTVREPSWTAGIEVPDSVQEGSSATVAPWVEGRPAEGFRYNYVWNYEGLWEEWGSTVLDTGAPTTSATWEFRPDKPGRYQLFVDVIDRMGFCRTVEAWLQVAERPDEGWTLAVEADGLTVKKGEALSVCPIIDGADAASFVYNYVWAYQGEWDIWGSTVKSTGAPTINDRWDFVPSMPGRYLLAVDATDGQGVTQTVTLWIDVECPWTANAVAPEVTEVGAPVTMRADIAGDEDGAFVFNYVWAYEGRWDEWGSTVKDTGAPTASPLGTFVPSRPGLYQLFVDVTDRDGYTQTCSCWINVVEKTK